MRLRTYLVGRSGSRLRSGLIAGTALALSAAVGFSATKTMRTAQQLYEGIDIGGETVGLITYMRTDGVQLGQEATQQTRALIRMANQSPNIERVLVGELAGRANIMLKARTLGLKLEERPHEQHCRRGALPAGISGPAEAAGNDGDLR